MKQVLEDCLKAARERYSGAQRFAFLIVAVFLAVHLTTVMQYLRREPAVRQASKDAETADRFSEATRQIAISTAELAQEEAHQTETIIRKFIDKLKTDLRQVDAAIVRARGLPTDSENQDIRFLQQQQQQQNVRDIIPELPQEFSEKLRSIQDNHAIRELLAPWIEEHVIQLRLDELRDEWEKEVWPKLAAIGVNINSWIDEAAKVWPKDPNLRDLETQVKVFVESGALLNFATPTDHAWWSTYQGKDSAGRYLERT